MNKYDHAFFWKYVTPWDEIQIVAHRHILVILSRIINNYFFGVLLPSFCYYYSARIQGWVPFFVLEIFLYFMFFRIIYKVFDWYNDVWIITQDGVTELNWGLFSANSISVKFKSIEWLEIQQYGIVDTLFGKWDLIIHKVWGENFELVEAASAHTILEEVDKRYKGIKQTEEEKKKKAEAAHSEEWAPKPENFETILQALTGVVEEYLGKHGFKKDTSKEKLLLIEKTKHLPWTIDLTEEEKKEEKKKEEKKDDHGH